MRRRPLHLLLLICISVQLSAQSIDVQSIRTYDGSFNNLQNPDWGAAGTNLLFLVPPAFEDGMSQPAAPDRPNPREISNTLFAQEGLLNDPLALSDFCWVWGQFIDHDIGITPDGHEPAFIPVPAGDPHFDPSGTGQVVIPMMRNRFDPATGTSSDNPRQFPNMITSFIDGSGVYGSDEAHAKWLRTFNGGKLKVSIGNLLPFNTTTGEFDAPVDPEAPHMDDAVGRSERLFVAGDVRVNENPLLIAFHTLFVREHNRLCEQLSRQHSDWSDEALYQHARKMVGGLIQSIVYEEWLPAMGLQLPAYSGYDPEQHPQLSNVFTAAAFRLGHTLLNGTLQRVDNEGNVLADGHLTLRESFFHPMVVLESGGIDPFFKGMAIQIQQGLDPQVIDDVRNFLFGPPGAGGLDLASININRGRERGLADLNTVRAAFGLPKYRFFQQINAKSAVFTRLFSLYVNIDDIDPWVGMLAEEPMPGALFGETLLTILRYQFTALRDGDRFYYENDPTLSVAEKEWIRKTTLRDLIMYNTSITLMQDNVFKAMPHADICDNMTGHIAGHIRTENGSPVGQADISLYLADDTWTLSSSVEGTFTFEKIPACKISALEISKTDNAHTGLSTLDAVLMQKHILGVELLDSPYKMIAADVDRNGRISVQDVIQLRRVILGLTDHFPNNEVWRFIPSSITFTQPGEALLEEIPDVLQFNGALAGSLVQDYIAVKTGDVNGSLVPAGHSGETLLAQRGPSDQPTLKLKDMSLVAGQVYRIPVFLSGDQPLSGIQFGLSVVPSAATLLAAEASDPALQDGHLGQLFESGQLTLSWSGIGRQQLSDEGPMITLKLQADRDGYLSDILQLDQRITPAEAYTTTLQILPVSIDYGTDGIVEGIAVGQNYPNPFREVTHIPFTIAEASDVELIIYDVHGRTLDHRKDYFPAGQNSWVLYRREWPAGRLFYKVIVGDFRQSRPMILVD